MFNVQLEPTIIKENLGVSRGLLSSVDPGGAYVSVAISKKAKIKQIQIRQLVGSGTFNVEFFSEVTHTDNVLSLVSDSTSDRMDMNKLDVYYQNTDTVQQSIIYLKINPVAGLGHTFTYALFFEKM